MTNRYAGRCTECGHEVPENGGELTGRRGAWTVKHRDGECTSTPATPAPEPVVDPPEGVHRDAEGFIYQVKMSRESRRPYAKRLDVASREFKYVGRTPFGKLSTETLMTYDEAVAISSQFGFCIRCSRTLSADLSVALGIGPVCGKRLHDQERQRRGEVVAAPPNPYVNMNARPPAEMVAAGHGVADPDYDPNVDEGRVDLDEHGARLAAEDDEDTSDWLAESPNRVIDENGVRRYSRVVLGPRAGRSRNLDAAIDVLDRAFPETA